MNKKSVLVTVFVTILVGMLGISFKAQRVEASGTIYIKADGSIEGTTSIQTADNVTYVFTADIINDSIVVQRDNIIIDGNVHVLQGTGQNDSKGVDLSGRTNVTVQKATIKAFGYGIFLNSSSYNTISGNNITANNMNSIFAAYSSSNTISGNNITANNLYGIALYYYPNNNTISGNNITNNNLGIGLAVSNNSKIYNNNFINNTQQAALLSDSWNTIWDDGYPSGGNYWSDYDGTGSDPDGIGDTEYVIDSNNIDHYPLMGLFHCFDTSMGTQVNVISNSTVEDFQYFDSNSTIVMHVSNMTSDQTFGFVRICIPHALINNTYQVKIDNVEPYYVNYSLYDNGTHRWIYFSYQHSTLEIIIIPEFPSFLILPLFMIATLLAVLAYKRKHALTVTRG